MKKIFGVLIVLLMCVSISACGNKEASFMKKESVTNGKPSSSIVYKQGQEAFIKDGNGNKIYSIKINSVKNAPEFEYKNDFTQTNQKQIIEVDYTYKNIAKDDSEGLLVHSGYFKVYDSTGAVGQSSDMFPKQAPQEISVGTNCTVQGYFGLANQSSNVKINFSSMEYPDNGPIAFEIPIK